MTDNQRAMLRAVRAAAPGWYRAQRSGERVTLANLWRHHGLLERRAWRGKAGETNAAYEYRIAQP